jgi:hypothetical protein
MATSLPLYLERQRQRSDWNASCVLAKTARVCGPAILRKILRPMERPQSLGQPSQYCPAESRPQAYNPTAIIVTRVVGKRSNGQAGLSASPERHRVPAAIRPPIAVKLADLPLLTRIHSMVSTLIALKRITVQSSPTLLADDVVAI